MSDQQFTALSHRVCNENKHTKDLYVFKERSEAVEKACSLFTTILSDRKVEKEQFLKFFSDLKTGLTYNSGYSYVETSHHQYFDIQIFSYGEPIRAATPN